MTWRNSFGNAITIGHERYLKIREEITDWTLIIDRLTPSAVALNFWPLSRPPPAKNVNE